MQEFLKIFAYIISALAFYGGLSGNPMVKQVATWLQSLANVLQKGKGAISPFDVGDMVIEVTVKPKGASLVMDRSNTQPLNIVQDDIEPPVVTEPAVSAAQ